MNSENQPQFERDLAQAAEPVEFGFDQSKPLNDPRESLEKGLITLYKNHLTLIDRQREAGLIDREKADELANNVLSLAENDGVKNEIRYTSTEKAQEIMGLNMFFGPEEVKNAGIEINEEIPAIPFNPEELERAKELGQMLIYRTSTTMKELYETMIQGSIDKRKLLFVAELQEDYEIYIGEKIQPGWALVSKELTPGSTDKDYLEQSEFLAEYLVNEVFKGKPLPREYQEAIDQLNAGKETIRRLVDYPDDYKLMIASEMLVNLKINQLFRQSPAEVLYDWFVLFQNIGERLHKSDYVWTSARNFNGELVIMGSSDPMDNFIRVDELTWHHVKLGVSFCRRGSDLKS